MKAQILNEIDIDGSSRILKNVQFKCMICSIFLVSKNIEKEIIMIKKNSFKNL